MTMLGQSHQQATLLVQAADAFAESQVFNDSAALKNGVMSDRARIIKSNLATFDDANNYAGAKFSPPTKASMRNHPENKSVSPITGKARYANLLSVHNASGNNPP